MIQKSRNRTIKVIVMSIIQKTSKDIKTQFPDIYRIILEFLKPSSLHIDLDLSNDVQGAFFNECRSGNIKGVEYLFHQIERVDVCNGIKYPYLLKEVDVRANKDLAVRLALKHGHLDVVNLLVEKGANVHSLDEWALRMSAKQGNLQVVKYLVEEHDANINVCNNEAYMSASKKGHQDVVDYLDSKGAGTLYFHHPFNPNAKTLFFEDHINTM